MNVGSIGASLKFGLAETLLIDSSMDWVFSRVDGIFGMSLANPTSTGLKSTLKQLAPHLDEPAFSSLTIRNASDDVSDPVRHFQIGSTRIEEQCEPEDYTYVPATSADGYHTRLLAIKLAYPNGTETRYELNMDMEFTNFATIQWAAMNVLEIHGDKPTVDAITKELGGLNTSTAYAQNIPCESDSPRPNIVFELGNGKHRGEWSLPPALYVQQAGLAASGALPVRRPMASDVPGLALL